MSPHNSQLLAFIETNSLPNTYVGVQIKTLRQAHLEVCVLLKALRAYIAHEPPWSVDSLLVPISANKVGAGKQNQNNVSECMQT